MNNEPEHVVLNEAFDAEVAELSIGDAPIGAMMKNGAGLRTRRRLATVSGAAALAVLPVAAVALYSGGAGTDDAAGKGGGSTPTKPHSTSTIPTTPTGGKTTPEPLLSSPTDALSKVDVGKASPPNPLDDIQVIASGTMGGQQWRLVRDRFVMKADGVPSTSSVHLPQSQLGRPGTVSCNFTGVQWGDRPPGTTPDLHAGGDCGPGNAVFTDVPDKFREIGADRVMNGSPGAVIPFFGNLNATKITSVKITLDGRTTASQPVYVLPGEKVGYYVVFLDYKPHWDPDATVTGYDAQGHVVGTQPFRYSQEPAHTYR
ncbi:MAG: hypothetical protein HOW97_22920 [Catenulispora sp.]|nr:hypothetical protein [Catenulispora sp.]